MPGKETYPMLTVLAMVAAAASSFGLTKPNPAEMPVLAMADCESDRTHNVRDPS